MASAFILMCFVVRLALCEPCAEPHIGRHHCSQHGTSLEPIAHINRVLKDQQRNRYKGAFYAWEALVSEQAGYAHEPLLLFLLAMAYK